MNKFLKIFVCGILVAVTVPCFADDAVEADVDADVVAVEVSESEPESAVVQTPVISARMDCKTMKAKIDGLKSAGTSDELSRLQLQYRKDCVVRASGLRTSYRGGALAGASASGDSKNVAAAAPKTNATASMPSIKATIVSQPAQNSAPASEPVTQPQAEPAPVQISDAQKEMCERLPEAIEKATADSKDTLQGTYDEYCAKNVAAPDAVVKTTMMVLGPAETEEEKYERIVANLDAGLCPDEKKPNKFGCCGDEKFTDIGNMEFACCPPDGECFPPIK